MCYHQENREKMNESRLQRNGLQAAFTFTGICYLDVTHSEHAVLYGESEKFWDKDWTKQSAPERMDC
ncbi:MAG TPA: hypothetical protein DCO72_03265 [Ruminococcus sp.]|nr:hypothetical protein [Ruminococcus sp.]